MTGGDAEQRAKGGVASAASVEAEDELVEVGEQMPVSQAVINAVQAVINACDRRLRPRL